MADTRYKLFEIKPADGYYQQIPLPVIQAVTKIKCESIAFVIFYECMVNQNSTVIISNVRAKKWGISRATKERQLIKLVKAEYIRMRQVKGKAAEVTWVGLK